MLFERLRRCTDIQSVAHFLLQRGLEVCQCDFGNVQLMNWKTGQLQIQAQRGFQEEFLNFFEYVKLSDTSACARALRNRESVVIEDVMLDPEFGPCREIVCRAGVRAVLSTPLLSTHGALVGILSTHFSTSHRPTGAQMLAVTDAACLAANAIIGLRADGDDFDRVRRSLQLLKESRRSLQRADQALETRVYNRATRTRPGARLAILPSVIYRESSREGELRQTRQESEEDGHTVWRELRQRKR